MKEIIACLGFIVTLNFGFAQSIYITSSGGSFPTEKWMSITTGPNGTGTQVWGQGNGTYGNGAGLLNDFQVDLSAYCGQTLYINAFDSYDDGWDGAKYAIYDAVAQSGNLLANNGDVSPDSGEDNDCSGSGWCLTDPLSELETSESFIVPACPCIFPVANFTILPDCSNGRFSIQVDISSIGDATAVDITDGTTTFETNISTGTYVVGPFIAGTNKTISILGSGYGGCDISSATLTEECVCSNSPIANVVGVNLDCVSYDYDIEVTVNSFGDGTTADILINGIIVQSNAVLLNTYTFSGYSTGAHTIKIVASGSAFVTCENMYSTNLTCNGSDNFSLSAPDITNSCSAGDLSSATVGLATGFTPSCDAGGVISGDVSNNVIRSCPLGFTNNTDYKDIWYQVDLPDGSDEMTLSVTGLNPGEILGFVLHTSDPGLNASNNVATVDGNFECSFFDQSITSHTITGLAGESTAPLYIRILGIAQNDGDCSTIATPSFTICTSIPQPNDICADAINIDGVTSTGDFCAANTDSEPAETCNVGSGCNACTESSETNDLWYTVSMNPGDPNQKLEVDITFPNASDEVVVTLYAGCFTNSQMDPGGVADCATITSSGAGSTVTHQFLSTITEGGSGPDWYIRVAPASGNTICSFDIKARRLAENNNCSHFQNVFPGFDITNPQNVDFNYSSDSQAYPSTTGNDLWYQFDPNSGTDNGLIVYSTSADINVSGLNAGEEITVFMYEGEGVASNNCSNLSGNYLASITLNSNGTSFYNCLNEVHGPTNGGYLVRIVQTAGGTTANPTVTITPSAQVGKYNNSCVNIWNGNSPRNLGVSDASHEFNSFYVLDGETISGSFAGTTDCDAEVTNSICSGLPNDPMSDANQRDLWYIFRVPSASCPGLNVSTVINSVDITYNASSSFRDAKLYVYTNCGDADLLACSPTLDGAGDTWTVSGLIQGEYYLIRVKPSALNSDFDYSFDLTLNNGVVRPCNNEGANAESLSVNSCNDYSSLSTYSMQGADKSSGTGVLENDVWFTFNAPSPANGGPYFNANKSWVTVFLENVSGTSSGPLYTQLYSSPTALVATATTYSTNTSAGSQSFAHFGHLNPGQTYYLRIYHKENETQSVDYKINVYTPNANETAWSCGLNNASLVSGCSEGCNDLREAYFKIDIPEGTPSNQYYMIEVVGEDQILDFELRSQFLTESSANEGDYDDYDIPCSSRPLEAGVSMVSETLGITSPLSGESCDLNGNTSDGGQGVRRVYFGMNGPASGMKDYYYIKVFMDASDPNYTTTKGLKICAINFNGPYTTQALAELGGAIDGSCSLTTLGVELVEFKGESFNDFDLLKWETSSEINNSHYVVEHSTDGIVFSEIAVVEGSGTTNQTNFYSYKNRRLTEENYYRLKQFDYDGTVTLSDIIYLKSKNVGLNIYPNPISDGGKFVISSDEFINEYEIRNSYGVIIKNQKNIELKSLEIENIIQSGVYIVNVFVGNQKITRKLVVK